MRDLFNTIMRNRDIDKLKSVLMYFVVLQHTLYFLNGWGYYNENLLRYNYVGECLRCIQMPGFMIVSGFLFKKSVFKEIKISGVFIKNILMSTVVPLISWGVFAYLIEEIGRYSWPSFFTFVWDKFWYFKVILFLKILFMIEHYIFKDKYILSVLIIMALMLNPSFQDNNFRQFSAMIPFFIVGYVISESSSEEFFIEERLELEHLVLCILGWIILFVVAKNTIGVYDWTLSSDSLSDKGITGIVYSIILKISGVYLLFEVVKRFPDNINYSWGSYTIFVYPIHCIMVDLLSTRSVFEYVNYHNQIYVTMRSCILAAVLFVVSNILAIYVKKNKVLGFLFMGKIRVNEK